MILCKLLTNTLYHPTPKTSHLKPHTSHQAAHSIAADIVNFSNRIQEFTLGNKANNLEIAITGYETALTVYTPLARCQTPPVGKCYKQ